jgi:WD40 repeat protein/Tfp pilus assembly protein PilF
MGIQVAEALEYANGQGVLHRDIKPSNLLLDMQGTVWVTDFGLAKATADGEDLTHTGDIVGTLRYMAPERFLGQSDARGDIYSLGLTLYELLVQQPAFDERDRSKLIQRVTHEEPARPRRLNPAIPRDLETIVLKAIEREPGRRYPTAGALAEDLKRFEEDKPIRARRISAGERLWRWCRRNPALAAATGLAAAALLAITVLAVLFSLAQSRSRADLSQAFQSLSAEQQRTQRALGRSQRLAKNLAAEQQRTKAEKRRAEQERDTSQRLAKTLAAEQKRTEEALKETRLLSARLLVERGQGLIEQRTAAVGMLWLARGLEMAPPDAVDLERVARTALAGLPSEIPVLWAVLNHSQQVEDAALSPDGRIILTASKDQAARFWDAATGRLIGNPLDHLGAVTAVAFSPDGKRALSGSDDRTAQLWDVATGKAAVRPLKHPGAVTAVAFSPDGKTIATACRDRLARLWEAATGKPIGPPLETFTNLGKVLFSADGKVLLTGFPGRDIRLWDTATGKPIGQPLVHPNSVFRAALSPDGKTVLTGCFDKKARLWDAATGQLLFAPLDHADWVIAVAFRPDGKVMLTGTRSGTAQLWDARTGRSVGQAMPHAAAVITADFSPDGRTVLTAGSDQSVRLWDADTGQPLGEPLRQTSAIVQARFSADGRRILTVGFNDKVVRLWERPSNRLLQAPLVHLDPLRVVAFSPDGKTLLTGSGAWPERRRGEAQLWDASTGQPIGPPLLHQDTVYAAAFSPDGKTVLTGGIDSTARLWDAATGKPLGEPLRHTTSVWVVAFSPDGKTLATAGAGKTVRLWDAGKSQTLRFSLAHARVNSVAFSPDGKVLATGGEDNLVRLWAVATGKPIGQPLPHGGAVRRLAFSPDGRRLLTGSLDKTARLWEVATGKPVGPPLAHQASVYWVAFSPDGQVVLTAGGQTVRLWKAADGKLLGPPLQHQEALGAVAFSPDGQTVLTGCRDGTVRLWLAKTGQPLGPPLAHQGPVTAVAFSPDGQRLLTGSQDRTARLWQAPAPLAGRAARLVRWVEVSSGLELTPEGLVQLLDGPQWQERQQALAKLGGPPDQPARAAGPGLGWHQRLAAESAAAGHWFAARWHLDRMIAARPGDWFAHALRSKAQLQLGRRDRAAADCARALKLGPLETVRDWFARQSPEYDPQIAWPTALWYLDQLIAAHPEDGPAHVLRSKAHLQLGHTEKADADHARAVALGPREAVLASYRTYCDECETREEWATEVWYLDRLIRILPRDAHLRERRGKAYVQLGQLEKAAAAFARTTELPGATIAAWTASATLQLYLGDADGYARICRRFLKILTNQAASARNSGAWLCSLGPNAVDDPARAVALAREAVAKEPRNANYVHTLGAALYRAGLFQEAVQRLEESMKLHVAGGRFSDWVLLAMAHHRLGHAALARQWLDRSVQWLDQSTPDKPRDASLGAPVPWNMWLQAQCLRHEAEALIRGSPRTADAKTWLAFARAHACLRQWDRAVADYGRALALQPGDGQLFAERGRCYVQQGRWDRAVADYDRAVVRQPNDPRLFRERGQCHLHLKERDEAAADFTRAADLLARTVPARQADFTAEPAVLVYRETLARTYRELAGLEFRAGQAARAGATLVQLRKLWPGDRAHLYATAQQIALGIPLVGQDPQKLTSEEQAQCRRLADQAMATLEEAVRAGFRDAAALQKDAEFDPLRSRDDFRALLAEQQRLNDFPAPTGEVTRLVGHASNWAVMGVAVSPDGRRALSAGVDKTARLWDLGTGQEIRRLEGFSKRVVGVSFSPDGRRALVVGDDPEIVLWDLETGKEVRRLVLPARWGAIARFLPDGRRALSCGSEHFLRLWDLETGQEVRRYTGHTDAIWDLALSRDGRRALSAGYDRTVRLWDVETGHEIRRLEGHQLRVFAVAFSPDGRRCASGCEDGLVRLWDLDTGRELRRLEGHWKAVRGVAFSPDGRHLVSCGLDRKLILWDASSGRPLHFFAAPVDQLGVAFLPDGRRFLTASDLGGWVLLWSASAQAARARDHARLGQLAQAESAYTRAITARPDDLDLRLERSQWYARQGQWARAAADLHEALRQRPDDGRALSLAARFHRRRAEDLQRQHQSREVAAHRQQARKRYEQLLAAQPNQADHAGEFAEFLLGDLGIAWTVLKPTRMTAAGGVTFTRLADGSILVGGRNPDNPTYTVVAETNRTGITALRLEALPDASLSGYGPGRGSGGNFQLSELTVQAAPRGAPERAVPVRLVDAVDTFSPMANVNEFLARRAIDGNDTTFWGINPVTGRAHWAVFQTGEGVGAAGGTILTFTLAFRDQEWRKNNLGRFRLSVTTQPQPLRWLAILVGPGVSGWTKLGLAHYRRGEWPAALAALKKATAPPAGGDGAARFLRALVHHRLRQHDQACRWFAQGVEWLGKNSADQAVNELAADALMALLWGELLQGN